MPKPGNPQALNRYTYGLNNPVSYSDPTGHAYYREGQGSPYFSRWDPRWQERWAAEHSGQWLTSQQAAVLDELNEYFGPLAEHIGQPPSRAVQASAKLGKWLANEYVFTGQTTSLELGGETYTLYETRAVNDIQPGPAGTTMATGGIGLSFFRDIAPAAAQTFGNHINYDPAFVSVLPTQAHEYYHVLDSARLGEFFWAAYALGGIWRLRGWGRNHPLEVKAYAIEDAYIQNNWLPHPSKIPWHKPKSK